jgi:superfamily I DNA/RNA helicase
MAHILPDTPPQHLPTEVLRVFRTLKALPDSFFIWHHLAPWQLNTPDFLVIDSQGRALLIKVSSASASQASVAAQFLLLESERAPLGQAKAQILKDFVEGIKLPVNQPIETVVIFPNIPDEQVQASRLERGDGEPAWAGKELLQAESSLGAWEALFPSQALDPLWLEKIRQHFTPEVVVPAAMTVRPALERRLEAGLTDYLLDYNQEAAVKADLDLFGEGQLLANDFRLNIINGVAGSGKTLILLYRLRLLHHLYPDKRILVLTHNKPLIHDMQSRFARLEGKDESPIEWRTFNAWCYQHWTKDPAWVEPMSLAQRERLVQEIWSGRLKETNITEKMLLTEIDWFKDQLPMNREGYLGVERRGRGFGLNQEQRQTMFDAMHAYQETLNKRRSLDWGDVPRRMWLMLEEGKIELPQYDIVLVDEAQFFAPIWMHLIRRALRSQNAHLFVVADPTQGFLGRGASWKSLGLEARGHSHQLQVSYRTTREILQFATLLYRLRVPQENDEDILAPDLLNMPSGAFPEIIPLPNPQDEIVRVANEVADFVKKGFPREHLLLLHAEGHGVHSLIHAIEQRLGKGAAMDPKETFPGNYVRVTTLNAGAGLESPIVFLVGLRDMLEAEQSLRLSDQEHEALIRDNTRKLYMAATRAGQRLVLTYSGELPEMLATSLKGK